jgi:alkyl hydroperoxide reductase subunit AhpF
MDPITTAILAALVAGVTAGATDVGKKAIIDAYEGLKGIIKKKFGSQNKVTEAISSLEGAPESEGRKLTLQEEVTATEADQDQDILAAVQELEKQLAAHGDERVQKMLRSAGGKQTMRGRGGKSTQDMSDSPDGEQIME